MIGQLQGVILEKQPPLLLINVGGVGYELDAQMSTFYQLPAIGQTVTLFTHLIVREDAHHLYGFSDREARQLFRTLLRVNGVGPRLALTILSRMNPDEFVRAVNAEDLDSLVSLPGVGQKTAGRLLVEMGDRLKDWSFGTVATTENISSVRHQILKDAISALVALGYKPQEAGRRVARVDNGLADSEEMIRLALQEGR